MRGTGQMKDRFKFRAWSDEYNRYLDKYDIYNETLATDYSIYTLLEFYGDSNKFIFEQCTGCRDYERKLIYTNDILKLNGVPDLYQCIFSTNRVGFDFKPLNTKYKWLDFFDHASDFIDHCKIVGNIHENSELLEEE